MIYDNYKPILKGHHILCYDFHIKCTTHTSISPFKQSTWSVTPLLLKNCSIASASVSDLSVIVGWVN